MAMGFKLADAFIDVTADTTKVEKAVEKVGDSKKPKKAGTNLGGTILDGISGMLKGAGVAVVGTAALGIGTALVKGFSRLDGLDQAKAKLTGLGHTTETVQTIMDNALASVKGTAFGMADAATVAASAVAAGVKPGADLERTLKAVADASTIAGTDMASMGAIFNKVKASNKLQMDSINQLHDAGIPALALVAEHLGVTAEEAAKMASKGEISFETFQTAMEKGMGGAALESGNTFSGAMDNVMAALGRVGANLLGGIFPQMTEGFQGLIAWLEPLEQGAKDVGVAIGGLLDLVVNGNFSGALRDSFGWEEDSEIVGFILDVRQGIIDITTAAVDLATRGFKWVTENIPTITNLALVVGILSAGFIALEAAAAVKAAGGLGKWMLATKLGTAAQAAFNLVMNANPIMLIVTAIAALVAGLVYFFTETELGREIWAGFTQFLGEAWEWLWNDILKPIFDAIAATFTWLYENIIAPIVNFIVSYINLWAFIFTWLWENVLSPVFKKIGEIFNWIWTFIIQPIVNLIVGYFQMWGAIFTWLWENVIKPVADFIGGAIEVLGGVFEDVFGTVGDVIRGAFDGVVGFIKGVINSVIDVINGALGGINSLISAVNSIPGVNFPKIPKIPRLAKGGTISGSGVALVGERGPEFVTLPQGATVHPHNSMPHMAGAEGGGGNVTIQNVTIDASSVDDIQKLIKVFSELGQKARQGRVVPVGA